MLELTEKSLQDILLSLNKLEAKAIKSKQLFNENVGAISGLIQYINYNKEALINNPDQNNNIYRNIIDQLAMLKTKQKTKIAVIKQLIDEFTQDDPDSVIYADLKKIMFEYRFTDFMNKNNAANMKIIKAITDHINQHGMFSLGTLESKKFIKDQLQKLASGSKDKEKLSLINSLKDKLDGVFAHNSVTNVAESTEELNITEIKSDWDRFFNAKSKLLINGQSISSFDQLKKNMQSLLSEEMLQFSRKKEQQLHGDDFVVRVLQQLKVVNMCGTDVFAAEHGVMISQKQTKSSDGIVYNIKKLPDGDIRVDFKCVAHACPIGKTAAQYKDGYITVGMLLNPKSHSLVINRVFEEKTTSTPNLDVAYKKR